MNESAQFTARCGLYCGDCIRSKKDFFVAVNTLAEWLTNVNFDQYAAYRAETAAEFKEYPAFVQFLRMIQQLACPTCQGGANPECRIKCCVTAKNIAGCWNCPTVDDCELLAVLNKKHVHLRANQQRIKERGLDDWSEQRGGHYRWES